MLGRVTGGARQAAVPTGGCRRISAIRFRYSWMSRARDDSFPIFRWMASVWASRISIRRGMIRSGIFVCR